VLATTLSLVVIFLPVAFMGGLVGKFWNSFGLTTTFAIMVSLLVAFTLSRRCWRRVSSPLAARNRRPPRRPTAAPAGSTGVSSTGYERLLRVSLRHRWAVLLVCAAIFASGWYLLKTSKLEFVVDDDMIES
jgi:HAE1 family hydrophobic/amphiphilic exporter-1